MTRPNQSDVLTAPSNQEVMQRSRRVRIHSMMTEATVAAAEIAKGSSTKVTNEVYSQSFNSSNSSVVIPQCSHSTLVLDFA